ncbi:MAG: hypothetical protein JWO05_3602 [Gemmatimonadetes bacterium]|nr:hypothetical protein [Gemmatimonadota bacterium]
MLATLRIAARTLRKQPAFASVVVLSLALAIALNTTMYSVLDALIHPQLDMAHAEQLWWVRMYGDYHFKVDDVARDSAVRQGMHSYSAITDYQQNFMSNELVEHGSNTREANVARISPDYFDFLGARPLYGRTFTPADAHAEQQPVVLTRKLATNLFNDASRAVGATVLFNHEPRLVVGVVSDHAMFPGEATGAWMIGPPPTKGMFVRLVRLRADRTRKDAEAELAAVARHIDEQGGYAPGEAAFRFAPAWDPEFQLKGFHEAMIFSVFAVLLVACANLANIQVARGIGRRRELALRSALGATRARLVGTLVMESALLAALGLALGLVLTYWGVRLLGSSLPPSVGELIVEPQWSWRVLLAALGSTALCVFLIGLIPAIRVSRMDPAELLKSGNGTGATKRNRRQYSVLVGAEIALALALLSGAAVMVHAAIRVSTVGMGYDPAPLAMGYLQVTLDSTRQRTVRDMMNDLETRLAGTPGVSVASVGSWRGLDQNALTYTDGTGTHEYESRGYGVRLVTPAFMRALALPIIRGRDFTPGVSDEGEIIVDETTAHELWGTANPVGQQLKLGAARTAARYARVIGVVGEQAGFSSKAMYADGGRARQLRGMYLVPPAGDTLRSRSHRMGFSFTVRASNGNGRNLALAVRNTLRGSGDVRVSSVASGNDAMGITRARDVTRFMAWMFTFFGTLGVALAAFGVYGVVAHSVAERRRELGVRLALGATSGDILHAVLRESAVVALAGIALGLLATKYGVQLLDAFAWPDDLYNAFLFAGTALVMFATVAGSAWLPALRATRIDPAESLRAE